MTIQMFLKNTVVLIRNNAEKYERNKYKAKYRALRRRERTQIKRSRAIIGVKIALRFWFRFCFIMTFFILTNLIEDADSYEFSPPNEKALELYSRNKDTFFHTKDIIEIIKFSKENDLVISALLANLLLGFLINNSN